MLLTELFIFTTTSPFSMNRCGRRLKQSVFLATHLIGQQRRRVAIFGWKSTEGGTD